MSNIGQKILSLPDSEIRTRLTDLYLKTKKIEPLKGLQGEPGLRGDAGEIGPQGPRGMPGPRGETGLQGIQGEPGPKGEKGDKGDRGPIGPQGMQGEQGIPGPKGDKGDPAPSLKDEHGNCNCCSCKNPPKVVYGGGGGLRGPTGLTGPQGPQGEQGLTGAQGPQGNPGANGVDGQDGDTAPVGTIIAYRFNDIPTNYLRLDGSTKNVDDYPSLGAKYGGSPGGTFVLDDFRDIPIFGASGTNAVGTITGSDTVDLSHTHSVSDTTNTVSDHTHTSGTLVNDTVAAHTHTLAHTHQIDPPNTSTSTPIGTASVAGALPGDDSPSHTHDVNIAEFTSGAASVSDTGSAGSHTHTISGSTASGGSHSHTLSTTSGSGLGSTDKKPRRAYGWWLIKAL